MKGLVSAILIMILAALPAAAEQFVAIRAGHAHTISGDSLENATILIKDGIIEAVGREIALPADCPILDFSGLHVYPGLINSLTSLGTSGTASLRALSDTTESGEFNPMLDAASAFYPWSNLIPIARSHGTLIALTAPAGGLISGSAVLLRLHGWLPEEMMLKRRAAMVVRFPGVPAGRMSRGPEPSPESQAKKRRELIDFITDARTYRRRAQAGLVKTPERRFVALDDLWSDAMPLIAVADSADDIRAAIKMGQDLELNIILHGAYEAESCLEEIKKSGYPVIVSSLYAANRKWDDGYDKVYRLPAALYQAGIPFAFSNYAAANSFDLPVQAGRAVAYGLPHREALKALTLNPARFFSLARNGALEKGYRADLVITDGDILESSTVVKAVFMDGRRVDAKDYFQGEKERAEGRSAGER